VSRKSWHSTYPAGSNAILSGPRNLGGGQARALPFQVGAKLSALQQQTEDSFKEVQQMGKDVQDSRDEAANFSEPPL